MKFIIKRFVKMLLGNQALQIKLFFFLAKILVERTDNPLDDKLLEMMRGAFGDVDTSDLG